MRKGLKRLKGGITAVPGVKAAGVHCGIKKKGGDLALIFCERDATAAGVFTSNQVQAAPVRFSRQQIRTGKIRAIVANSGNANACTGAQGYRDACKMAEVTAACLGVSPSRVLVASTGVIGKRLPMRRIVSAIPSLVKALRGNGGGDAGRAIMTTDTRPKLAALRWEVGGYPVSLGGIAKGSGMISPRMATMLCFLATDAYARRGVLQKILREAVEKSFNRITVDGDTSTNDCVFLLATGEKRVAPEIDEKTPFGALFKEALLAVCLDLAKMIVQDGEGATKLLEVNVQGAPSAAQAKAVGLAIANSPLVKTALFGEDPNWGRILAAAGNAGVPFNPDRVDLSIGKFSLVRRGEPLPPAQEAKVRKLMRKRNISMRIHLHRGSGEAVVWASDLSPEYVRINAAYRS
ncbi:MAG: bifunctional glutamate N-acetyltransferase/amino-acid acetyltransferase ArgJ [Candidatus Tectomicrobia bacterium]|uniref:Arginine biosynthesis bifunctional protein ArgJ n=1 Tax=Tectimicrobiota bacterium TaxID=2528274 RepID=A0A932GS60_UNCTE|nr:bifunctional glutamate N-acetyltransferase/amino-acid acetyltransferase ArgJ [Candidatus Tectomicrobia bacterium]